MRSAIVVVMVVLVGFFALDSQAQEIASRVFDRTKLTKPAKQFVSLSDALSKLAKDYDVHIVYDDAIVQGKYAPVLASTSQGFYDALVSVINENPLAFKKVGARTIVLTEPEPANAVAEAFANTEVQGVVLDNVGLPLPGANVIVKGTTVGAATDLNGNFRFVYDVDKEFTVVVMYMGYKTQNQTFLPGADLSNIRFELTEDVFESEAVVVTGIASKRSKAISEIAVARLNAAKLTESQSYTGLAQLVTGKIPGIKTSIASGNVGAGWRFHVRGGGGLSGDGQPVIYIDGIRVDNDEFSLGWTGGQRASSMSNLNPNDIESVEILKGPAAAAMYGTSGSNGVVLITTKGGQLSSGKPNLEYKFTLGTNQYWYERDPEKYLNADLYNSVLEPPGVIREHQVALSGGTPRFQYRTSFTNRYEEGLVGYQNWMDRNSLRANITATPYKNMSVKVTTGFTWNDQRSPQWDNNTYSWSSNAFTYEKSFRGADSLAIANYEMLYSSTQFLGSAQISYEPFQNFEIQIGAGLESVLWDGTEHRPVGFRYGTGSNSTKGLKDIERRSSNQYTYDFNARYTANVFNIGITSIVGTQILERRLFETFAGSDVFANEFIQDVEAGEEKEIATENRRHAKAAGIYWNNEFSYDDTYYWTLAVRKDYSSVIGSEAPAIIYPKGSFAVRADRWGILPSDISMLKLRVAYGETGQLPSLDDGIPITWTTNPAFDGTIGYEIESTGNAAIKPERIKEWEFGLDAEFFNMFSLEFTHYRENATDLLVNSTPSPSTGLFDYSFPVNVGSITSYGFETMLQINPIRSANYDLNFTFIHSYQQNEVKELGETEELIFGGNQVIRPGLPKYEFYVNVPEEPIFDEDPTSKTYQQYVGATMSEERKRIGNPIPNHTGSISTSFRFLKNFNFYASGDWSWKNYIHARGFGRNYNYFTYLPMRRLALELQYREFGDGNTREKPVDAGLVLLTPGTPEYIAAAHEYVKYQRVDANLIKDASFFVFRELSLSYNFKDLMAKYFPNNNIIKSLTMGIAVNNVIRWSKYDLGFDLSADGGRSSNLGEDYNTLSPPRSISFYSHFGF